MKAVQPCEPKNSEEISHYIDMVAALMMINQYKLARQYYTYLFDGALLNKDQMIFNALQDISLNIKENYSVLPPTETTPAITETGPYRGLQLQNYNLFLLLANLDSLEQQKMTVLRSKVRQKNRRKKTKGKMQPKYSKAFNKRLNQSINQLDQIICGLLSDNLSSSFTFQGKEFKFDKFIEIYARTNPNFTIGDFIDYILKNKHVEFNFSSQDHHIVSDTLQAIRRYFDLFSGIPEQYYVVPKYFNEKLLRFFKTVTELFENKLTNSTMQSKFIKIYDEEIRKLRYSLKNVLAQKKTNKKYIGEFNEISTQLHKLQDAASKLKTGEDFILTQGCHNLDTCLIQIASTNFHCTEEIILELSSVINKYQQLIETGRSPLSMRLIEAYKNLLGYMKKVFIRNQQAETHATKLLISELESKRDTLAKKAKSRARKKSKAKTHRHIQRLAKKYAKTTTNQEVTEKSNPFAYLEVLFAKGQYGELLEQAQLGLDSITFEDSPINLFRAVQVCDLAAAVSTQLEDLDEQDYFKDLLLKYAQQIPVDSKFSDLAQPYISFHGMNNFALEDDSWDADEIDQEVSADTEVMRYATDMPLPDIIDQLNLNPELGDFFVVGGAVRDHLLSIKNNDIDMVYTGDLPSLAKHINLHSEKLGRVYAEYIDASYPIVILHLNNGETIDIGHLEQKHDRLDDNLIANANKRDFLDKALFYDPRNKTVLDCFDGRALEVLFNSKQLTSVAPTFESFKTDPVRILRGIRSATSAGFAITDEMMDAMQKTAPLLATLPASKLFQQICKTLFHDKYSGDSFLFLQQANILSHLFVGFTQDNKSYNNSLHKIFLGSESNGQWQSYPGVVGLAALMIPALNMAMCRNGNNAVKAISEVVEQQQALFSFQKRYLQQIKATLLYYLMPDCEDDNLLSQLDISKHGIAFHNQMSYAANLLQEFIPSLAIFNGPECIKAINSSMLTAYKISGEHRKNILTSHVSSKTTAKPL